MSIFAVARLTDIRSCGAFIAGTKTNNVLVNMLPICVVGDLDDHGGIAITGSATVFANGVPICRVTDINDVCRFMTPHHYAQPLCCGSIDVFSV